MADRRRHHLSLGACAGRYLARRLYLADIESFADAAIPAFGQVRQAQGTGA